MQGSHLWLLSGANFYYREYTINMDELSRRKRPCYVHRSTLLSSRILGLPRYALVAIARSAFPSMSDEAIQIYITALIERMEKRTAESAL